MSSGNKKDDELVAKEFNHGLLVGYLIAQVFQAAEPRLQQDKQKSEPSSSSSSSSKACFPAYAHTKAKNRERFPLLLFENLRLFVTQQCNL